MDACAITDHGNMYGAAYFFQYCKDNDIKPIFGCEVYTCKNRKDFSPETGKSRNHLILLAQNQTGYHNLIKLVSAGWLEGFYYKPRVDKELLKKYADGLFCLSACIAGEIPRAILADQMEDARNLVLEYASIYPDRFYLELQHNGLKEQAKINDGLLELSKSCSVPLVATNDCHYLDKNDSYAHEVLLCIQTQTTMQDPNRMRFETDELYFKSAEDMQQAFGHIPQALANSAEIASRCNVELDFGHHYFPVYPLPESESLASEFRRLATEGLTKRLEKHPQKDTLDIDLYWKRLNYELDVIEEMGFPGYFLIVQEFINWAKNHHIPVGPGRGSAAGSLVAWAMRITNLDPLPYNLLFERFLNIERISLPDIDVDFCERRRPEVIRHMVDRYGEDSVAQITTFGTMKAKGVVRDVGRALGISYADTDKIARLIPDDLKMTIDIALEKEPELQKLYTSSKDVAHLVDTAKRLEGLARHASTHAAGLVVSDKPMEDYLPLYRGKRGELVTQFDGPMTEKTGLVKFDFLGLKTMTLIQDTLDNIASQGKDIPDLDNLPLNDSATYDLYSRGDTDGVFQVESSGMRQYLRMLKPSTFEDVIAMLALYRPGPLGSGMVDEFIKRKHGQVPIIYPHKSLENCLSDTYGVIVYQEQVMQIAQIIASYTLGGADLLRRAMGKKKAEVMAKERATFVKGAVNNGIQEKKANEIFDLMEKFAAYGFNKSHSAAYALISYYTAWLKTHYPVEFMAALLTSEMGNQDKLLKYISCCKDMNIEVLPPSVNGSRREFTALNGKVMFGLGGIKNVGDEAIRELVANHDEGGDYASLLDLCCRVNLRKISKRVLESLIKGGACDCLGATRAAMLACMEIVTARGQKIGKTRNSPQVSLMGLTKSAPVQKLTGVGIEIDEANLQELLEEDKLKFEKEALGFFLTSHPLQPYAKEIHNRHMVTLDSLHEKPAGSQINCAVLVTNIKEVFTKSKGERMAFVNVEDLTGHAEVTFFPRDYMQAREALNSDQPVFLTAKIEYASSGKETWEGEDSGEDREVEIKLQGNAARPLAQVCKLEDLPFVIEIPENRLDPHSLEILKNILLSYQGSREVQAKVHVKEFLCHMTTNMRVHSTPELQKKIDNWLMA